MKELLIINSDSSANSLLKSRLEKEGYSVETVEDGKIGIQKAREEKYRFILVDYHLPETNGPEVCYMLRHGSTTRQSKILFLAAENEEELSPRKMDVCSDGFICSQDTLDEIIISIKRLMNTNPGSLSS